MDETRHALTERAPRIGWTAVGIAVVIAAAALSPARLSPAATLLAALAAGSALAVRAVVVGTRADGWPGGRLWACAAGALCAAPALGSVFAARPGVSVVGLVGQHAGAATWLAGLVWLVAACLGATRTDVRWIARLVGATGAVLGCLAVAQRVGIVARRTLEWGSAEAVFDNPLVYGQFAVIAVACAITWSLMARGDVERWVARVCTLAAAAGVAAAGSAGTWAGLAAAACAYALLGLGADTERRERMAAIAVAGGTAVFSAAALVVARGMLGDSVFAWADRAGNLRFTLWRSVAARVVEHPLAARGLEQFSAWTLWTFRNDGLETQAAYDPHNIVFAAWLAAGLVGAVALLVGVGWLAVLLARAVDGSGGARMTRMLVAAVAGYWVTLLFSWLSPAPLVVAASLVGLLAGSTARGDSGGRRVGLATAAAAALAGAALLVVCAGPVMTEARWAAAARTGDVPVANASIAALAAWPDPTYRWAAAEVLSADALRGDSSARATALTLLDDPSGDARWFADLALAQFTVGAPLEADAASRTQRIERGLAAGKEADPSSGLWEYLAQKLRAEPPKQLAPAE